MCHWHSSSCFDTRRTSLSLSASQTELSNSAASCTTPTCDIGLICGDVREVQRYLQLREGFDRDCFAAHIPCGDLHARIQIINFRAYVVKLEREIIRVRVELEVGESWKAKVDGRARE